MIQIHTRRVRGIWLAVVVDDNRDVMVTWSLTEEGARRRMLVGLTRRDDVLEPR